MLARLFRKNQKMNFFQLKGILPCLRRPKHTSFLVIGWALLSFPFVKLNIDGSSLGNTSASCGGDLIHALPTFYGFQTNMMAETITLLEDLQLCIKDIINLEG